jgi:hypothetical protein
VFFDLALCLAVALFHQHRVGAFGAAERLIGIAAQQ